MPVLPLEQPALALSDADLIRRTLQNGQSKAFRLLMERYLPLVYNHLYRMTQNHELSEEMTQDAFVKVYTHLASFDTERSFKPWLLRIASNAAISALRKHANRTVSLSEMEENTGFDPPSGHAGDDPAMALEEQFTSEVVLAEVGKLDEKYRIPILLRYQADYKYEEVAEATGLPLNTVRTRLKRGLEKLKDGLAMLANSAEQQSQKQMSQNLLEGGAG
jgi:RNA polymerase sigma-70 factor (ECF subfamily)